jgi:hypothetical protein
MTGYRQYKPEDYDHFQHTRQIKNIEQISGQAPFQFQETTWTVIINDKPVVLCGIAETDLGTELWAIVGDQVPYSAMKIMRRMLKHCVELYEIKRLYARIEYDIYKRYRFAKWFGFTYKNDDDNGVIMEANYG